MSTEATAATGVFGGAVEEVRSGADARAVARRLLDALTPEERLGLLDGDRPFWPGMPQMMGEGYNLEPIVAGAVDRLGIPGSGSATGRAGR